MDDSWFLWGLIGVAVLYAAWLALDRFREATTGHHGGAAVLRTAAPSAIITGYEDDGTRVVIELNQSSGVVSCVISIWNPGNTGASPDSSTNLTLTNCQASLDCERVRADSSYWFLRPHLDVTASKTQFVVVITGAANQSGTRVLHTTEATNDRFVAFVRSCGLPTIQ